MTTPNLQPPAANKKSWLKVLRVWFLLVGSILFWIVFWAVVQKNRHSGENLEAVSFSGNKEDFFVHFIFNLFVGGFFLALGIGAYAVALFTQCLTTNFTVPVWSTLKVKNWVANLLVLLGVGLGVGFLAAAFLTPVLAQMGVSPQMSGFLPVIGGVGVVQLICIWFLIWAPLEKRIIDRRLAAMGLTPAQLQTGMYVGLSNPEEKSVGKRFGAIEEDVGMLWVTPDSLIYYGDNEQMNITRELLVSVERQVDGRSSTALSGTAHVILGVLLPNGTVRRIRLHTEGVRTMGGKRKAMDQLSAAIDGWRGMESSRFQAPSSS
jgi:hypothetical protein